jgi:ferredoxin--NADP+ reductase
MPGLYCAGWIKRGPTGIIGTNKKDATETIDQLLADLEAGLVHAGDRDGDLVTLLAGRGVDVVMYDGWQAIDEVERAQGAPLGRPRVKLTSWDELIEAARG